MDPIELLKQAWSNSEWYAVSTAIVILSIRIFRKPWIQKLLQKPYRWKSWPKWSRQIVVFVMSLANTLGISFLNGGCWKQGLLASLPVAIGAILGHKTSKVIGHEITYQKAMNTKAANQPFKPYKPSKAMRALDLVFPIDNKLIDIVNLDNLDKK